MDLHHSHHACGVLVSLELGNIMSDPRDYEAEAWGWDSCIEHEVIADWQRHGVRVTEDCETCGTQGGWEGLHDRGKYDHGWQECPDCGGTGKKLRDGVTTFGVGSWYCNNCGEDCRAEAGCDNPSYDDKNFLAFPIEWLEKSDAGD